MRLGVYLETSTLRQVIVHRPGLELARLTRRTSAGCCSTT